MAAVYRLTDPVRNFGDQEADWLVTHLEVEHQTDDAVEHDDGDRSPATYQFVRVTPEALEEIEDDSKLGKRMVRRLEDMLKSYGKNKDHSGIWVDLLVSW